MTTEAGNRKLAQARFHLSNLRSAHDVHDDFRVECYFAAFLACVRSVAMYVHEWQRSNGKATSDGDWSAINTWEAALPADDLACWRAAVQIRNRDIHHEPVELVTAWVGGWNVGWDAGWSAGLDGAELVTHVTNPKTGGEFRAVDLCERALAVTEKLLAEHASI